MSDELTWLPGWRLTELIAKREVSCLEVTDHFLGRIEELNPTLHAFEEVDYAGAREQARAADRAVASGEELGDLHGVPTAVKSHIRVAGLRFRQGATDELSDVDDIAVERLRKAGAIVVGTNTMMGAGANLRSMEPGVFSPFNWDAEARSPWDLDRVPGWSSSGGAAAAAARLLPVTIGTDGGGSTRLPAAYSGVVGLHTSRGLIPHVDYRKPTMMLTASLGPLARDVRDAALFARAMSGPDGRDYVVVQDERADCVVGLDRGVDGMRMAWTEDFGFASAYATEDSARIIDVARAAAQSLTSLGAQVETTEDVWEDRAAHGTVRWTVEPAAYEVMVGTNLTPLQPVPLPRAGGVPGAQLGALPQVLRRVRRPALRHGTTDRGAHDRVGPRLDGRRSVVPGRELRTRLLQPHDDLQLAGLPGRLGAVRLRRRDARGPADRRVARPRGPGAAGRPGVPAGVPPGRASPRQLTVGVGPVRSPFG